MILSPARADMAEILRLGTGKLLYDGEDGAILLSPDGTMLTSDVQSGERLCSLIRTLCPALPEVFSLKNECAAEILLREFSLHASTRCTQWVYEKSEPPFPAAAEIRPLTMAHAAFAASVYHDGDGSYIRDRIGHGALWGVFEEEQLAGFAGFHAEGSMGMLEILPPFRCHGYAMQLEAFLIAAALKAGRIPYCHVIDGNEASLRLQQKLGLTCAELPAIWVD